MVGVPMLDHFSRSELAWPTTGEVRLAPCFGEALKQLRIKLDAPIYLTSACRSPGHNAEVRGHPRSLVGVEISDDIAALARIRGFDVMVGNIDAIDLPDGIFDIIFLQQVIEHVHDPASVLQKISVALRDGELVIIETPARECIDHGLFRSRFWGGYHSPRHFNRFSEFDLCGIAARYGFELVQSNYLPQPGHWVWSLHHLLKDKGVGKWAYKYFQEYNPLVMAIFTLVEIIQIIYTKRALNMRLTLRKPR